MRRKLAIFALVFFCYQLLACGEVFELDELPHIITLERGESYLVLGEDFSRVIAGNPEILEVTLLSKGELVLNGRAAGETNLIIAAKEGYFQFQVRVVGEKSWQPRDLREALGMPQVRVSKKGSAAVLEGRVESDEARRKAEEIAALFAEEVLSFLAVPVAPQKQVAIKVRIVEVAEHSWEQLGVLWGAELSGAEGQPQVGISSRGELKLAAALHQLAAQGDVKLIAEPALLSLDGEEATFLAGGEIPIPISVGELVAIDWKTYGVKLDLRAQLEEEGIRVQLAPEVSQLDWNQGIRVGGSLVPALATRRVQTQVSIPSGGTVVIAGLGQQQTGTRTRKAPWWERLPLLGGLFRYRTYEESKGELAIFLTAWEAPGLEASPVLEELGREEEVQASTAVEVSYEDTR